ncbi:hypothetical protein [Aridibaculum aurantiacum]|uniref:hypothetical protein n=1 Tax=Aridibaculum aurantiacum TaxID=2810307 RepID=UPI001A965AF4|nr:hypothetical protein [Aridibaculum aurantiacum]
MPQITLSVPKEKLPLLQEFLQALGIEGQHIQSMFRKSRKNEKSASAASQQPFSWEYYCNELEFE